MTIPWLEHDTPFPQVSMALTSGDFAPGLLAAGADLSPQRLLQAYRHGIFPWYSEGQPILWWSTDPRMVLRTADFKISPSLKKTLKKIHYSMQTKGCWQVRFDTAFENVVRACAGSRPGAAGTWINDEMIAGYTGLHQLGYAHCSELWRDNELVGGAYGVCIGRMFFGESMFSRSTDASKIALAYLVHFLQLHDVSMIDCQQETAHLASLGAKPMPRDQFMKEMQLAISLPAIKSWFPGDLF
jgi:leucyl/phenylalanyl-tRNA--protein transferase